MVDLPFNESFIIELSKIDIDWLVDVAKIISDLGDFFFYLVLLSSIYLVIDKHKGYQLMFIALINTYLNILLKLIIVNERPNDLYHRVEAVSYSTPSGHAQSASAVWTSLIFLFRNKYILVIGVVLILLVGLSRPFLGVHYFEDVIIGWLLGFLIAFFLLKIWDKVPKTSDLIYSSSIILVTLGISLTLVLIHQFDLNAEELTTYTGMLAGLIIGRKLELKYVNFSSRAPNVVNGLLRLLIAFPIILALLFGLAQINGLILGEDRYDIWAHLLRYIRYFTVTIVATYIVPLILVKSNLALVEKEITL